MGMAFGIAFFLIGSVVMLAGVISVIKPITLFKIKTRKAGAVVVLVGLVIFIFSLFLAVTDEPPEGVVVAAGDAASVSTGAAKEAERAEEARSIEEAERAKEAARLAEAERLKEAERAEEARRIEEAERLEEAKRVREARRVKILQMAAERAGYDSIEKYQVANRQYESAQKVEEKRAALCKEDWSRCKTQSELLNNYVRLFRGRSACEIQAEEMAQYGEPDFPWFSFHHFYPWEKSNQTGQVTLIEPKAKFQNMFGAMAKTEVICLYDLRSETVVRVDIQ